MSEARKYHKDEKTEVCRLIALFVRQNAWSVLAADSGNALNLHRKMSLFWKEKVN